MVCTGETVRFKSVFVFVKQDLKKAFFSTLFKKDGTEGEQSSARLEKYRLKKIENIL